MQSDPSPQMARAFVLASHVGRAPPSHSAPRALVCATVLQRREPLKRLMGGPLTAGDRDNPERQ